MRKYFNGRGISNASIDRYMLGLGEIDGHYGYVIPVFNREGKVAYVKIRRTPEDDSVDTIAETMNEKNPIPKWTKYPADAETLLVGEDQLVKSTSSDVLICKSELDRIIAMQEGVEMPVVTGGGFAQTFKKEWMEQLRNMRNIYICLGKGVVGERGAEKLAQRLSRHVPAASIYIISLPFKECMAADLIDYFAQRRGTAKELFSKYATYYGGAKPIDVSEFTEMTVEDIADVLDLTIKYDFVSKVVTFLTMLLTYTESDQQNIMFNADSSTGKTYICSEVSKYFPPQDVKVYGKTTPTAFYYSQSLQACPCGRSTGAAASCRCSCHP